MINGKVPKFLYFVFDAPAQVMSSISITKYANTFSTTNRIFNWPKWLPNRAPCNYLTLIEFALSPHGPAIHSHFAGKTSKWYKNVNDCWRTTTPEIMSRHRWNFLWIYIAVISRSIQLTSVCGDPVYVKVKRPQYLLHSMIIICTRMKPQRAGVCLSEATCLFYLARLVGHNLRVFNRIRIFYLGYLLIFGIRKE